MNQKQWDEEVAPVVVGWLLLIFMLGIPFMIGKAVHDYRVSQTNLKS